MQDRAMLLWALSVRGRIAHRFDDAERPDPAGATALPQHAFRSWPERQAGNVSIRLLEGVRPPWPVLAAVATSGEPGRLRSPQAARAPVPPPPGR